MNDNARSNLARTIRKYREARKMTMKQLSIKSGINLSTIKKYETDRLEKCLRHRIFRYGCQTSCRARRAKFPKSPEKNVSGRAKISR